MGKKIGFIDLFIDEWHANNYPAWFRESAARGDFEMGLAWEEASAGGRPLDAWCAELGMTPARSIAEVIEGSDAICVLAPSNPEVHERLAELPLRSGKPVYIDKPFAPDRESAERMFRLAEKHGTPLMSCSALRFAAELMEAKAGNFADQKISLTSVRGGGDVFSEYVIHQAEIIVALMGCGAWRVRRQGKGGGIQILVEYDDGCIASLAWHPMLAFGAPVVVGEEKAVSLDTLSNFFPNLIAAMLNFFQTGRAPIPQAETLEVVALAAAAIQAAGSDGAWIDVEK